MDNKPEREPYITQYIIGGMLLCNILFFVYKLIESAFF